MKPQGSVKAPRSLKARALQWLAQREQSRVELRRKLMPLARAEDAAAALLGAAADGLGGAPSAAPVDYEASARAGCRSVDREPTVPQGSALIEPPAAVDAKASAKAPAEPAAARVEALLDSLEAHEYLSEERFVESRVHARWARFGNLRIRQELKQHQVTLTPDAARALGQSEFQRARAVRDRKFAHWPATAAERAKQARFLAGRGFSPDVIGRVLRGSAERAEEDV